MRVRRSRTSLAQGKADPIDRIAESGERRAIGGFRPRIVALLCLLGLLLPMLSVPQPVAVQTWAPAAGFDSGARLAVDSDVAKQPALLAKLGILDSDVRRGPAGGKTLLLLPSDVRPGWTIIAVHGRPPEPDVRPPDRGILRGNRSPTGPPTATA